MLVSNIYFTMSKILQCSVNVVDNIGVNSPGANNFICHQA